MEERSSFNLLGLLPEVVETIEEQAERAWIQYQVSKPKSTNIFTCATFRHQRNLFYRLVQNHLEEMMPVILHPNGGCRL